MNQKNKYLIIIPITQFVSWNWSADYIRQTVITLSKMGFSVIVYMDSEGDFLLKKSDKILPKIKNVNFVIPRYYIPFNKYNRIRELNRKFDFESLINRFNKDKKIFFWTFGPVSPTIFKAVKKNKKITSIYDCVDYYGSTNSKIDSYKKTTENELIKNVDYFFVNSHALQNLHKSVRLGHLVVQGFAEEIYKQRIRKMVSLPHNKPIIGFVGTLDLRIDFKLLYTLINKFNKYNFVIWGPIYESEIKEDQTKYKYFKKMMLNKNIIYGKSDRKKIPGLMKQFDIGIIPYDLNLNFCKYCYPMKLFEYFYLGKPIITTPIFELKRFSGLVKICKTESDWIKTIKIMINKSLTQNEISLQKRLAIENSWKNKINQILNEL